MSEDMYDRQRERLLLLAKTIAKFVADKDRHYGSSWRQRGGVGAFMVIARKWDRIEQACKLHSYDKRHQSPFDIFERFQHDDRQETITDDVVDLIGYLLVLLEHMIMLGHVKTVCEQDFSSSIIQQLDIIEREIAKPTGMDHPFGYDEEEEEI